MEDNKIPIILIGENHEIKEHVREFRNGNYTNKNINSYLHDFIENKVCSRIEELIKNDENKNRILFFNEGQDKNERCKNIQRHLKKITKNMNMQEFHEDHVLEIYYMSGFMNVLRIINEILEIFVSSYLEL